MYEPALKHFIYAVKTQGMLNGDYAFIASSLTLSSSFWDDDFFSNNNIDIKDIDGNFFNFNTFHLDVLQNVQ